MLEIEKKFLINENGILLDAYPYFTIEQGYISTQPVIRIRRKDNKCIITYKSSGMMVREEFEEPISEEQYLRLKKKIDYHLIKKRRYLVPLDQDLTAEVDVFESYLAGLIMAEVEFSSEDQANDFKPPSWFTKEVTFNSIFHNNHLCQENDISFLEGV